MAITEEDFSEPSTFLGVTSSTARGEVSVGYTVTRYIYPDSVMYDWRTDADDESDEWYETFEEAEEDARRSLGE